MKALFISLGCDKNLVDSETMLGILGKEGYTFTDDETEAEVIVINTCCFINDAKEESINTILQMAEYRKEGSCKALIVTGCLAERYREEIMQEVLHLIRETAPEEKPSEKPEILQQELAFLQKRKNRLTEQYLQGELEEEEFCFAIGQYRKQAARLRQGLQEEHVSGFEAESLRPVLNALLSEEGEAICGHLLQEMKIDRQGNVSLRLKHCEAVWLFALPK